MEFFWTHQDNIPESHGFGLFSLSHFIMLFLMLLLTVSIIIKYKNSESDSRMQIRFGIAVSLAVIEIAKIIVMGVTEAVVSNNLPLEICSFAAYAIILDVILKDKRALSQMLLYLFLPAALMALLFPTTTVLPVINFFSWHQFIFHTLIVAYALMRFAAGEVELNYLSVWKAIGIISAIAFFVYIIDFAFNRNFMFLMDTYDNFMLNIIWNITGGGLLYDLGLVVFSIIVIHIVFIFFLLVSRLLQIVGQKRWSVSSGA